MVSCVLTIKIADSIAPRNLRLKDKSNNKIIENDFYVKYDQESKFLLEVDSGGIVNYYEIRPAINGFYLDKTTGDLTVRMTEYLINYKFEIVAHYDKTSIVSRNYNFTVLYPCTDEEKLHYVVIKSTAPNCQLGMKYHKDDEDWIIPYGILFMNSGEAKTSTYCAVPGNKTLKVSPQKTYYTYVADVYSDDVLVDSVSGRGNSDFNINTEMKKPEIVYINGTKFDLYGNDKVNISTEVKYIKSCSISPKLPSCLKLNELNCSITGNVNESYPTTEYTVTAMNSVYQTKVNITLTLYDEDIQTACRKLGKTYIKFFFTGFDPSNYWSYLVYRTEDMDKVSRKAVINLNGEKLGWTYGSFYYESCIDEDKYTVVHKDSNGQGFSYYYMLTSINNIPLVKASLDEEEKEYIQNINTINTYNYLSEWEYSYQHIDGWDDISKISGKWSESALSELSNNDGITTYIRKIESYEDTGEFSAYLLKVRYLSGILIKINGKELFRNNLPTNVDIKPSDMANNMYNEIREEVFALPISMFDEVDKTIISIELHRHNDETNFPIIDVLMTGVIGDKANCLVLNKLANENIETNTGNSYVKYAFDESPHNSWYGDVIPEWAIMRYNDNIHTYFNQLSLTTNEYYAIPTIVSMDGLYEDEWISLAQFSNIEYNEKKVIFPNYNMTKMYSAIRITVEEADRANDFQIKEINFHLCPLRFCPGVLDLPITATGDIVELKCSDPTITTGNRKFLCENDKTWKQIENTCDEGPKFMKYESVYGFKAGSIYKDVLLYLVSGKNLEFSMDPTIDGLVLNKTTGRISGQPIRELSPQSFKFTVKNDVDQVGQSVNIVLSVKASNIPIKIWSNDSVTIESGKPYSLTLFLVAGSDLEYKVDQLPTGFVIDPKTGVISGTTFEEQEREIASKFFIGNDEENIIIIVQIKIELPVKPVLVKYDKEVNVIYGETYEVLQPYKCLAKTISYSVEPKLLDHLEMDKDTGIISGKVNVEPTNITSFTYTFKCSNDKNDIISNEVVIHVSKSVAPVIISHVDSITVDGGIEYTNISLCYVTGENLGYSIVPKPPVDTLIFNENTGELSGYTYKYFEPVNLTVYISGSGKEVRFSFMLKSHILDEPVVVNSTVVNSIVLDFGQTATVIKKLFTVVGDNIHITVQPDLPRGLNLNSKTGEISGIPLEFVEEKTYSFIITNPPSTKEEKVDVKISFKSVVCQSDSGFPETVAEKGGKEVKIKCGGSNSGMKIRKCYLTDDGKGVWTTIDESECSMSSGAIAGIAIGSVAVGLIVIIGIVFCLLRTGLFTKKARSASMNKGVHKLDVDNKQTGAVRM